MAASGNNSFGASSAAFSAPWLVLAKVAARSRGGRAAAAAPRRATRVQCPAATARHGDRALTPLLYIVSVLCMMAQNVDERVSQPAPLRPASRARGAAPAHLPNRNYPALGFT
ncbi:hypothetical protein MSG28_003744 [Choristoneura fumiferana]|uniref:Uncharacterized protein n=1 Tax=Choristoneura fumiferana TaxID=7141 RepID=A0ACC0KH34_CHOFU|nr:hypothetical protein MSG28_003744 [Choristoneura fumiferana]